MGTITLQDRAIRGVFRYESGHLRDGTHERHVDADHCLVFVASLHASNRRLSCKFTFHDGLGYVWTVVLPYLTSSDTATSRPVTLSIFHSCLQTLTSTCTRAVWCADESTRRAADVELRKDGNIFRVYQSNAPRMDSGRSNWLAVPLAHRGPLCLAHCRQPHAPPPGHNCRGRHHRPRMQVRTGAARVANCGCAAARWGHWREPCIWGDVDNTRTVDGNSVPAWDGPECHAGRLGWVRRARHPQQQYPLRYSSIVSSLAKKATPMPILRGSDELGGRCTKRTGRVICQWRVEASTCHWRQTANTGGGRGGVTRCGQGHAWAASADISGYWDSWWYP